MHLGIFMSPGHPPELTRERGGYKKAFDWDVEVIKQADRLGYTEAWIGEHFTHPWEPCPAPDLIIQAAAAVTTNIKLCPGAHLPPFHHPAELASRISYQDQILEGRYMLGLGAGSVPSDFTMFNIDAAAGQHRDMMREGFQIMMKYWTEEGPWRFEGEFWTVEKAPEDSFPPAPGALGDHLRPYQEPHPPIAVSGLSPSSPSLEWAGTMGYMPMSLNMNNRFMSGHWEAYARGAESAGRTADRGAWRIAREILVADTDDEAIDHAKNGFLGRFHRDMLVPAFTAFDFLQYWKHEDSVPDEDVTIDYLIEHQWLVGSVETVTKKLLAMQQDSGGFGTLLIECVDYSDRPEAWMRSMQLLAEEVAPQIPA
jgi:alkanesulfonate monooxygenase SsuD/methylene tetrahydromethanopterin reductase-like flavin-dependent oxidoreductase (luciferase family)